MVAGELRVIQRIGKLAVIHLVIVPPDPLLGHAGGTTGLENIERLLLEFLWHPHLRLLITQPFVLEVGEL